MRKTENKNIIQQQGSKSLEFGLLQALSSICRDGGDAKRRLSIARNMLTLGKLIVSWKDTVGLQLASKTCPNKLIKGKLYLTVCDSQWMQTLLFLKSQIITKIGVTFPHLKITEIIGKIGVIPEEVKKIVQDAVWPDWEKEPIIATEGLKDQTLSDTISRCRQKSSARIKGLETRGYKLCIICRSVPTRSDDGVCAMCVFNSRTESRSKTRALISEMPWLTYEETLESDHELSFVEYDSIREELFNYSETLINEYGKDLLIEYDDDTFLRLKKEITRAIILRTGCMPDQVDLSNIETSDFPDPAWSKYLTPLLNKDN